ncbi:DegV family protein, partial [Candidatus Bipolaricaulota bacterium]|nr:DegV family protein [Candidatus Bipolaricaulota bacterium]
KLAVITASDFDDPMFVVSHSAALELAKQVQATLLQRFPKSKVWITDTTPAIGSHAGPGGIAISVLDAGLINKSILMGDSS